MKVFTNKNVKPNADVESSGGDKNIAIFVSTHSPSRCIQGLKVILCIQLILFISWLAFADIQGYGAVSLFSSYHSPPAVEKFQPLDASARISDIASVTPKFDPITSTTVLKNKDAAEHAKIDSVSQLMSEVNEKLEIESEMNELSKTLKEFQDQVIGKLDELMGNDEPNVDDKSNNFFNVLTDMTQLSNLDDAERQLTAQESGLNDWLLPVLVNTDDTLENESPITIYIKTTGLEDDSEDNSFGFFHGTSERSEDSLKILFDVTSRQSDEDDRFDFTSRHSEEGTNGLTTTESDPQTTLLDVLMKSYWEIENEKSEETNEKSAETEDKTEETDEKSAETNEESSETSDKPDRSSEEDHDLWWFFEHPPGQQDDSSESFKTPDALIPQVQDQDSDADKEDKDPADFGEAYDMMKTVPEVPERSSEASDTFVSTESSDYLLDSDYYSSYEDEEKDSLTTMLTSLLDDLKSAIPEELPMMNDELTADGQAQDEDSEVISELSDDKSCDPVTEIFVVGSTMFPDWKNKCVDREVYEKAALDKLIEETEATFDLGRLS